MRALRIYWLLTYKHIVRIVNVITNAIIKRSVAAHINQLTFCPYEYDIYLFRRIYTIETKLNVNLIN